MVRAVAALPQLDRRALLSLTGWLGVNLVVPGALASPTAAFAPSDLALIADVAELIIPATDTGGAKQAGVPAFVELMVSQWMAPDERDHFTAGVAAFANGAVTRYGRPFTALSQAQQSEYYGELLRRAEVTVTVAGKTPPRTPFVVLMKRLTIFGYYTSELGGSVELTTNVVPGEFVPDAPVTADMRAPSDGSMTFPPLSTW